MKYNNHKRGFLGVIVGLIFILACLVGLYYVLFYRTEYVAPVSGSQKVQSEEVTASSTENAKETTYVGTVTSMFEEVSRTSFQFTYPQADFAVSSSNDGKNISLTETAAGSSTPLVHKITVSFEGGRGYTPADYWTNVGKKSCSGCSAVVAPFTIAGATSTVSYGNSQKTVVIVQGPSPEWLFAFELQKPAEAAAQVFGTFSFK